MSNEAERLCIEGLELMSQHRWVEAEEKMAQAVKEDDQSPELWYNLGKCRFHQDKYEEAKPALCAAIMLRASAPASEGETDIEYPVKWLKYPEASALLGSCDYAMGDVLSAEHMFSGAIDPSNSDDFNRECRTARAHCMLSRGEYDDYGWSAYQERLKEPDTWDGTQSLVGKTLLVKAEGGLGDQIFFARYARMLDALGVGYVLWEVDEPLVSYMNRLKHVVVRGKETPEHDYMVHAGSLPYIFGTKRGTIPVFSDYPCYVVSPMRIGLAYSGNPLHPDDHHRSIPLAEFEPLLSLDKNFYLMQKDVRYTDIPLSGSLLQQEFANVQDMADAIRNMDLVITVDTMTAHLAGAEGIPTWLLLPYAPDWRWKLEGDRTPWYPSIKIFRQGSDRQWGPVIQRVVEELKNA